MTLPLIFTLTDFVMQMTPLLEVVSFLDVSATLKTCEKFLIGPNKWIVKNEQFSKKEKRKTLNFKREFISHELCTVALLSCGYYRETVLVMPLRASYFYLSRRNTWNDGNGRLEILLLLFGAESRH